MSGDIQAGYPIRRVSECLQSETTNTTWHPWVVCCPNTLSPVNYGNNEQCNAHITDTGPVPYDCANSTWNLWSHAGYFCCEKDQAGFWISDKDNWAYTSYGCEKESLVRRNASLSIANLQTSPSMLCSLSFRLLFSFSFLCLVHVCHGTKSSQAPKPGPNKGAIAGGVVGGVCGLLIIIGLIWFFYRRRRSRSYIKQQEEHPMNSRTGGGFHTELNGTDRETSELEGTQELRGELYDPSPMRNELPADDRIRLELKGDIPQGVKVVKQESAAELP